MKRLAVIAGISIAAIGMLAGCATNRGATSDDYESVNTAEAHPQPAGSPTQRPGMNPQDPRDAQFGSKPDLLPSPPTTQP